MAGFDCSGFAKFVLTQSGLNIPDYIGQDHLPRPIRHTNEFWDQYGVYVHEDLRREGDLVFFSRKGVFPTHMGIVRDPESYIHAPGKDGTKVEIRELRSEPINISEDRGEPLYVVNPIGFKSPTVAIPEPDYRYHQQIV